jgi:hypothetical protein
MTRTGIVTPGDVLAISLTLCACITRSRHKKPGDDYRTVCSCREVVGRQESGGGVVARRGEALSLATVRDERPSSLYALFRVHVWGLGVVRPGGWRLGRAARQRPRRRGLTAGAFPL